MKALSIRRDRSPVVLRKLAKAETDARVVRRMLAIANALSGMSRGDAARSAGMDRQTLRDWVTRYNEHGVDGLVDLWGNGRPPKLTPEEKATLVAMVLAGSDHEASGIPAFTSEHLVGLCKERFGKSLHVSSMGRILRELGLSRQKTRPSHPQKEPAAQSAFRKSPGAAQRKLSVRIKTSASASSSRASGARSMSGGGTASARRDLCDKRFTFA